MDNKIRFAVIGTEGIGRSHIEGILRNENAVLAALCDVDEAGVKARAEKHGLPTYYTDYRDMLRAGGFDCVVVCSPDSFHKDQCVDSLEAGYHVLCEKPLAMRLDECEAIIAAARASGKKFMVGQVCRKTPAFALMKEMVDRGDIGELFYVESEYAHDYSILGRGEWRKDPSYIRHPVVGGGCHAMDLLRWIAGDPTEVFAYANHKMLPDWPVDDCTISVLKYPNGVIGKVLTSIGCKRPYTMRTQIFGSKGTILGDNKSSYITLFTPCIDEKGKHSFKEEQIPIDINHHNMAAEIADMCDIILGKKELEIDVIEGSNTVAVCLAAVESAKTGLPVKPKYFN